VTVQVETKGPFFEKDPRKTFRANARDMLKGIAEEGDDAVQAAITFGRGPEPHHIADGVYGRVEALSGKPWALTAVVSVPESRRGHVFHLYGRVLERKYHWLRKGVSRIRKHRREAEKLLRGLQ
jgi:hypothetical protein